MIWKKMTLLMPAMLFIALSAGAQQRIGYVDSDAILEKTPEYATIQQQVNTLAREWETEIENNRKEVDRLFREYQSRELLYTNDERNRKREEIVRAEEDIERLRIKYFGPEGDLFKQQESLMRPLQEKILAAIEAGKSLEEVKRDNSISAAYDSTHGNGFIKPEVMREIFYKSLKSE